MTVKKKFDARHGDRRHGRSPGASVCRPDLGARKGQPCREQFRAERHPGIDGQEQCPAAGRKSVRRDGRKRALTETAALRL